MTGTCDVTERSADLKEGGAPHGRQVPLPADDNTTPEDENTPITIRKLDRLETTTPNPADSLKVICALAGSTDIEYQSMSVLMVHGNIMNHQTRQQ
jgi:hypothetical protein